MISLIVPVYNGEKYLMNMVDSLFRQTYGDFEVIFSEDGSTDRSLQLLHELERQDARVRVVTGENLGVSTARNRALQLARGEYIGFCDSDDVLEEDYLRTLLSLLEDYEADVSVCGFTRIYEASGVCDRLPVRDGGVEVTDRDGFFARQLRPDGYTTVMWNKLFRREALLDENGKLLEFDSRYHIVEDGEFIFRSRVEKAVFTTELLYRYTVRTSGAMYGKLNQRKLTELPARRKIAQYAEASSKEVADLAKMKYQKGVRDLMFHAVLGGNYREIKHLFPELRRYKYELFASPALTGKEKLKYKVYPVIILLNLRRLGSFLMAKLSGH